jgi:hypothetical protein
MAIGSNPLRSTRKSAQIGVISWAPIWPAPGAVGLEDAHRPGGADPVAVKEDHDLPDNLLLGPCVRDPFGSNRADARHLASRSGSASMTSKTFSPKALTIFLA